MYEDEYDVCPQCGAEGWMYRQPKLDSEDYEDGRAVYSPETYYEWVCAKCGYTEGSGGRI